MGQKQKTEKREREKKREKKKRLNVGNNNGKLRIAMPPGVAHAKPPGPITVCKLDPARDILSLFLLNLLTWF